MTLLQASIAAPGPLPPARRAWAVAGVGLAVLLLHAALLGLVPRTVGGPAPGAAGVAPRPLQVRQLAPTEALPPEAPQTTPAPAPQTVASLAPAPEALAPRPSRERRPTPRESEAKEPMPEEAGEGAGPPAQLSDNDTLAGAPGEAAPAALPAGTPLPTYATRLPPAATLQYTVQRGGGRMGGGIGADPARAGLQAQLIWRPDTAASSYTLSLGLGAVGSASVGALDLHGIAPERHVETRRGREVRAANFQRQADAETGGAGRITFSGPRIEHPLLPGVQDRLSWMLQLAGVLAANPALGQPGREISLLVVGVRGDAALWVFRVVSVQALQLPAGEVLNAVHLQREAQRPYDTRVDVWLDPARHHLPVRLRLQNRADAPGTEFELLQMSF